MKVLIVDDSKTMIKINENVCKGLGIKEIYTAENGFDGFTIFNENKDIDLILLDINMPIMNGYEMLEKVRHISKDVKIFMCTTEGGKEEVIKALRLGANNYIVKPIKREVLEEKIRNLNLF